MKPVRILLLLLLIAGCNSGGEKPGEITLLTLKGPSAVGMIYLIDSPDGVIPGKLNIEILDEPMIVRARMLKDRPEMTVLPLNMAAILYNKGLPYQLVAVPVWGSLYLFGTDTAITDWESLRNKRIFLMGKGTTPDIVFRFLLERNGLDPERDVTLDYSFPTHIDLANAVGAGIAALAVISEPLVSLARLRNPAVRQILDLNREWQKVFPDEPDLPQTALLARSDFIGEHPGWVRKICDRWAQSTDSVNRYPALAAPGIVASHILPDTTAARLSVPGSHLKFGFASDLRPVIIRYLQVLYNFNPDAVGGKIPDEKFIAPRPDH
jgi:NitT/TauT family transport system substrate-binding protein